MNDTNPYHSAGNHDQHAKIGQPASCVLCDEESRANAAWRETVCRSCGDQFMAPPWEDPADTLCVACAEDEQQS